MIARKQALERRMSRQARRGQAGDREHDQDPVLRNGMLGSQRKEEARTEAKDTEAKDQAAKAKAKEKDPSARCSTEKHITQPVDRHWAKFNKGGTRLKIGTHCFRSALSTLSRLRSRSQKVRRPIVADCEGK